MWTRLLYMPLPQAFRPALVNGKWHRPTIGARYRNMLKYHFKANAVPWTFDHKERGINPRHKEPKGHKFERERPIKLAKIKKALENQPEMVLKYRQDAINNRKLTGIDHAIKMTTPSFLVHRTPETEATNIIAKAAVNKYKKKKREIRYFESYERPATQEEEEDDE